MALNPLLHQLVPGEPEVLGLLALLLLHESRAATRFDGVRRTNERALALAANPAECELLTRRLSM